MLLSNVVQLAISKWPRFACGCLHFDAIGPWCCCWLDGCKTLQMYSLSQSLLLQISFASVSVPIYNRWDFFCLVFCQSCNKHRPPFCSVCLTGQSDSMLHLHETWQKHTTENAALHCCCLWQLSGSVQQHWKSRAAACAILLHCMGFWSVWRLHCLQCGRLYEGCSFMALFGKSTRVASFSMQYS